MAERTVLVAEDDPDHRQIVATILRHRGYRVLEAEDGAVALQEARRHAPDVVVMDAALPGLDGWTVIERLKADPGTHSIPVLLVTGQVLEKARSDRSGCDGYLEKPCDPREVLAEVERLLATVAPPPAPGL